MKDIIFVRTNVWKLNRSFGHLLDARSYVKKIRSQVKDVKILVNGIVCMNF